jgi:hypothetical protein
VENRPGKVKMGILAMFVYNLSALRRKGPDSELAESPCGEARLVNESCLSIPKVYTGSDQASSAPRIIVYQYTHTLIREYEYG